MTTLTMIDEKRLDIIHRASRSEITVLQAARVLGLSERQCYRVKARVNKVGAKGVVHVYRPIDAPPSVDIRLQIVDFEQRHVGQSLLLAAYHNGNLERTAIHAPDSRTRPFLPRSRISQGSLADSHHY